MTSPGRYAADDGSFGKSAGSAAARGGVLVAVAVVIGLIILAVGFDGGDDTATGSTDSGDSNATTTAPTTTAPGEEGEEGDETPTTSAGEGEGEEGGSTTLAPTPSTRPPGEVKVAVGNGVGEPGLAGIAQEKLTSAGYVTDASNASTLPTPETAIYYVDGYASDAAAVAAVLGSPADVITAAPADPGSLVASEVVDDFHVFVIQGEDRLAG